MKQRAKEDLVDCSEVKKPCDNPNCPKTRVKRSYDHKNMGEGFIVCGKHESGTPHLHSDTEYPQTAPGSSTSLEHAAFRGGHADIGGGYKERGLANITCQYIASEGRNVGVPSGSLPLSTLRTMKKSGFTDEMMWHQEIPTYNLGRFSDRNITTKIKAHDITRHLKGATKPGQTFYYQNPNITNYFL